MVEENHREFPKSFRFFKEKENGTILAKISGEKVEKARKIGHEQKTLISAFS